MAKIGSFGDTVFEVSNEKILTFSDFSRTGDARWVNHDINLSKPTPEFVGIGQESISIKITFKITHGIDPEKELEKLRSFRDKGKVSSFILGNKPITSGYWYLESISEGHKFIDDKGRAQSIEATLSIKEYPKPVVPTVIPKPKVEETNKDPVAAAGKLLGTITIKANMLNCRATPSLKGKILKVLRANQSHKVYGTKQTDITWYDLGNAQYCSANSKYVSFKKA